MSRSTWSYVASLSALLAVIACGQAPSFKGDLTNLGGNSSRDAAANTSGTGADATANDPEQLPPGYIAAHPTSGTGSGSTSVTAAGGTTTMGSGTTTTGTTTGSTTTTSSSSGSTTTTTSTYTPPSIPGADPSDIPYLDKCLASWHGGPFGSTPIQNYKKIYAAVSVLSSGNAIDDEERTPGPELILIDAGVNVLGTPSYQLLNPNGYYCIKVNVNVLTTLNVNLDCAAHLADSRVDVSVLSTQNSTTSAVGVTVLSTVKVNNIKDSSATCIR